MRRTVRTERCSPQTSAATRGRQVPLRAALARRASQHGAQHPVVEANLHPSAGACQHPPAGVVEQPHDEKQERDDPQQREQRRLRARAQHTVVHLKHEQRPGQHQEIDEDAEQSARAKEPTALSERIADLTLAVGGVSRRVHAVRSGSCGSNSCGDAFDRRHEPREYISVPLVLQAPTSVDSPWDIAACIWLGEFWLRRSTAPRRRCRKGG